MKQLLAILLFASCGSSFAQTGITVMSDTNRVIRTNFTLTRAQVTDLSGASFAISNITGLQTSLDGKLATNGSAASLTNFPASVLLTNGNAVGLTNFPASLLRTNGDASGLTNFPPLALSNATGVLDIAKGGTGATNASLAISNLLPSYTGNSNKVLGLNSNATSLIWTTNAGGGGGLTSPVAVVDGGTGATNAINARINLLPSYSNNASKVLAVTTNSGDVEWIAVSNTVTDGASITNLQASNLVGVISITKGGTGQTNAAAAIEALLPAYTNNASKFLALNTNATALEWVTNSGGGGGGLTSPVAIVDGGTGQTNALAALSALFVDNFSDTNVGAIHSVIGSGTTSSSSYASGISLGFTNALNNNYTIGIGSLNTIGGEYGVAIGFSNNVTASEAVAIGTETKAGSAAVGIGYLAKAHDSSTIAIGTLAIATNNRSIAIGSEASAKQGNIAIGYYSVAAGSSGAAVAIGYGAIATNNGVAIGIDATVYSTGAAVGRSAQARNGFAGGGYAYALGTNSVQLGDGYNNTAETIQFRNAGLVNTNEWAALANAGTVGTNLLQAANITNAQAAIFTATTTNAPTNTNAPTPNAWLDIRVGTNDYKLPLWQ